MQKRVSDISKIQRLIGYKPTVTIDQILAAVIAFHEYQRVPALVAPPQT